MTQWGSDSNSEAGQPAQPDPWAAPPAGGATPPPPPPPAQPDPWAAPPPPPAPPGPAYGAPQPPAYGAPQQPPAYGTPPPPPPAYGQQPYGQPAFGGYPPAPGYGAMPAMGVPGGPVADMGARFLARLIDWGILIGSYIVVLILAAILGKIGFLLVLLWFVGVFAYPIYFNGGPKQATIGKQVMGLKVVDSTTGGPIGFGRAFIREFLLGLCFIVALSPFFDDTKRFQGWHDKVGNDFVIKTK